MFGFFKKKSMELSENELRGFVDQFGLISSDEAAEFIWRAVVLNYQMSQKDLDWSKALGSDQGQNMGLCTQYVVTTNGYINDLHKSDRAADLIGMKIWNMTFRSMSLLSFHHYGVSLWRDIHSKREEVSLLAEEMIASVNSSNAADTLRNASYLVDYVPPQFKQYI